MSERSATQVELGYIKDAIEATGERIGNGFEGVNDRLDKINGRVRDNEVQIAGIKGRASTAGVVSGAVSGVAAALAAFFGLGSS